MIETGSGDKAEHGRRDGSGNTGAASARARPAATAAPTMDQRSPNRRVTRDAGRLKNQDPSPINVTISAATATEAPRSRADNATTGRMAPCPIPKSKVG